MPSTPLARPRRTVTAAALPAGRGNPWLWVRNPTRGTEWTGGGALLDGHCCLWSRPALWPNATSTPEVKNRGTNRKAVTAKGKGRMVIQEGKAVLRLSTPHDHLRGPGERDAVTSQLHHTRRLKAGSQAHACLWSLTRRNRGRGPWQTRGHARDDAVDEWLMTAGAPASVSFCR